MEEKCWLDKRGGCCCAFCGPCLYCVDLCLSITIFILGLTILISSCIIPAILTFVPSLFILLYVVQYCLCHNEGHKVLVVRDFFLFSLAPLMVEFIIANLLYKQMIYVPLLKKGEGAYGHGNEYFMIVFLFLHLIVTVGLFLYFLKVQIHLSFYSVDWRKAIIVFFASSILMTLFINVFLSFGFMSVLVVVAMLTTIASIVLFIVFFYLILNRNYRKREQFEYTVKQKSIKYGFIATGIIFGLSFIMFFVSLGVRASYVSTIKKAPELLYEAYECQLPRSFNSLSSTLAPSASSDPLLSNFLSSTFSLLHHSSLSSASPFPSVNTSFSSFMPLLDSTHMNFPSSSFVSLLDESSSLQTVDDSLDVVLQLLGDEGNEDSTNTGSLAGSLTRSLALLTDKQTELGDNAGGVDVSSVFGRDLIAGSPAAATLDSTQSFRPKILSKEYYHDSCPWYDTSIYFYEMVPKSCCSIFDNNKELLKSTPDIQHATAAEIGFFALMLICTACGGFMAYVYRENRKEQELRELLDDLLLLYVMDRMLAVRGSEGEGGEREQRRQNIINAFNSNRRKAFDTDPRFSIDTPLGRFNRAIYETREAPVLAKDKLLLRIDRTRMAMSSYTQLRTCTADELRGTLFVFFENESGIDAGGLRKDWINAFSKTFLGDMTTLTHQTSSSSSSSSAAASDSSSSSFSSSSSTVSDSSSSPSSSSASSTSLSSFLSSLQPQAETTNATDPPLAPLLVPYTVTDERLVIPRGGYYRRGQSPPDWYTILGRFLGIAVRESIPVGLQLHPSVIFALLDKTPTLDDLRDFDTDLFGSLTDLISCPDPSAMMLDFTVTVEEYTDTRASSEKDKVAGKDKDREWKLERKDIELKPGGAQIAVDVSNVQEYVRLLIEEKYVSSISKERASLQAGFLDALPANAVPLFKQLEPAQLSREIGGVQVLDVEDWKVHTHYAEPLTAEHQLVVWFWSIVEAMNNDEKKLLLKFVTSQTVLPVGGFAQLRGSSAVEGLPFEIRMLSYGGRGSFPKSHTCFNILELPQYDTREDMERQLLSSIKGPGSEGFDD